MDLSIQKQAFKQVFSKPKYLIMALIIGSITFTFTNVAINLPIVLDMFSAGFIPAMLFIWNLMLGSFFAWGITSTLTQATLSLFVGLSISMLIFKVNSASNLDTKSTTSSLGGILAVMLSTGCASCGMGVLSLLGIAGGLAVLPFQGLEIWFIGLALVLYSMYHISFSIVGVCKA